jgi:hypothetical protein
MVSRYLMGFWTLMDILLLGAGGLSVGMSIVWKKPDLIMNTVLTPGMLLGAVLSIFLQSLPSLIICLSTAGLILGIMLLITFVVSVGAIVQANHVTIGLVILNYCLVVDSIAVLIVGTFIWYPSLQQRAIFHKAWASFTDPERTMLQNKWKCCGYFNASDIAVVGSGSDFCTQTQVTFLNVLDLGNDDNAHFFCVKPYTAASDYTLENTFTYVSPRIYFIPAILTLVRSSALCTLSWFPSWVFYLPPSASSTRETRRSASRRSIPSVAAKASSKSYMHWMLCRHSSYFTIFLHPLVT